MALTKQTHLQPSANLRGGVRYGGILRETVVMETHHRTETRANSESNPYTVRMPYSWYMMTCHPIGTFPLCVAKGKADSFQN